MVAHTPLPSTPHDGLVTGRRAAARLRLAIPARFVSLTGTQSCILLDMSSTGARMALAAPVGEGQSGLLEIAHCEAFGTVVRTERRIGGGINAMVFDDPLPKSEVLAIRRFAEDFALREHNALRDQVRRWVSGED